MKVNEKLNFYETETMNEIEAMYITFTYSLLSISIATPVEWTSFYQIFSLCFSFKSYYFVASTYIMAHCLDALWIVSWLHWFDFFFVVSVFHLILLDLPSKQPRVAKQKNQPNRLRFLIFYDRHSRSMCSIAHFFNVYVYTFAN